MYKSHLFQFHSATPMHVTAANATILPALSLIPRAVSGGPPNHSSSAQCLPHHSSVEKPSVWPPFVSPCENSLRLGVQCLLQPGPYWFSNFSYSSSEKRADSLQTGLFLRYFYLVSTIGNVVEVGNVKKSQEGTCKSGFLFLKKFGISGNTRSSFLCDNVHKYCQVSAVPFG